MAHPQPFTTLVYQHHTSPSLSGSSPIDSGRQYATFQWRGTPPSPLDPTNNGSPLSLRQTTQDFYTTSDLSPTGFPTSFQASQPQMYSFPLSDDSMDSARSRQIDSSIGPRRAFTRRRSARQQRMRGELLTQQDDPLAFPTDAQRYELRSTRLRPDPLLPLGAAPTSHLSDTSDQSREMSYTSPPFSDPSSPTSTLDPSWNAFQPFDAQRRAFHRADSPGALSSGSISGFSASPGPAPLIAQQKRSKKKKRVSSTDKMKICRMHEDNPEMRQQDIAQKFAVERSTVSKILKDKERWLSIPRNERRTVYRLRDTKFPQLEEMMQQWLRECQTENKTITDAAIREKAKSLVPDLVLMGTFKASAGWLDNFKQRNGIRQGRWEGLGTRAKDERATGHLAMAQKRAEQITVSGELPPGWERKLLEESGLLHDQDSEAEEEDDAEADAAGTSNTTAGAGAAAADTPTTETPATDGDVEMSEDSQVQNEPSSAEQAGPAPSDTASGAPVGVGTNADEPMVVTQDSADTPVPTASEHADGSDEAQPYMYSEDSTPGDFSVPEGSGEGAFDEQFAAGQDDHGPIDPGTGQPIATIENAAALVVNWMRGQSTVFNAEERKVLQKVHNVIVDMGTTGIADPGRFS